MKDKIGAKTGKKSIGVYVSSHFVDLVELYDVGGRAHLGRTFHVPITKPAEGGEEEIGIPFDTSFEKTALVRERLTEIVRETGKNQAVITAVKPKDSVSRYFTMPRITDRDRTESVKFEAKKYIPFRLEEIFTNTFVVSEDARLGQMGVLFVGAKKEQVNNLIGIIESAGLSTSVIDTVASALIRTFESNHQLDPKATSMIIYREHEIASIIIVKNSVPYLIRDIYFSFDETNIKEKIAHEVTLSTDFYKRQFPTEEISKIILTGNTDFEGWAEYFTQTLSITSEIGDINKAVPSAKEPVSPALAVAFGLALRGLEKPKKIQVNLTPTALIPVKENLIKDIVVHAAVVAGILIAFSFYFNRPAYEIKKKIKQVQAQMPDVEQSIKQAGVDTLKQTKKDIEAKLTFLDTVVGKRIYLSEKLSALPKILPRESWVLEFDYNEKMWRSEKTKYLNRLSRSIVLKGIVADRDRQREINRLNSIPLAVKNNKAFFEGFQVVQLSSTKVVVIANREVTDFRLMVSGEYNYDSRKK